MINGRRPQLDLEQVYGDGPALGTGANLGETEADILYRHAEALEGGRSTARVRRTASDPTGRQSLPICAITKTSTSANCTARFCCSTTISSQSWWARLSNNERYITARRLVRWAYQYVVVNDYLRTVCDPVVVDDILANGNRYYAPKHGRSLSSVRIFDSGIPLWPLDDPPTIQHQRQPYRDHHRAEIVANFEPLVRCSITPPESCSRSTLSNGIILFSLADNRLPRWRAGSIP